MTFPVEIGWKLDYWQKMRILKAPNGSGFSLVELLVVVGVIVLLVALSFPVLNRFRESGLTAKCTSNMREIGILFRSYLADNDNRMPQRFYPGAPGRLGYDELLLPYGEGDRKVFTCPAHQTVNFPSDPSYGMNWYYDNASAISVPSTSRTILAAESWGSDGTGSHRADRNNAPPGRIDEGRHSGLSNFLFFDGHVERLERDRTLEASVPDGEDVIDMWGDDHGRHNEPPPEWALN